MKTKIIKLKRLWNKLASIRDYMVDDAIKQNYSIQIEVEGQAGYMLLTPKDLEQRKFQIKPTMIRSKFGQKVYTLYDFSWAPNDPSHISEAEKSLQLQAEEEAKKPKQETLF